MNILKNVLSEQEINDVKISITDLLKDFDVVIEITTEIIENMTNIPSDQDGKVFASYYGGFVMIVEVKEKTGFVVHIQ